MTDDGQFGGGPDEPGGGHVGDLISAHLDGELDAETSAGVRQHLESCEPCRELAADTAAARAWVRSLPDVDATPVVEHLLARHRAAIRAGAAFVGLAAVVVGSLALTAAVIRPDVTPDVDGLVAVHQAAATLLAEEAAGHQSSSEVMVGFAGLSRGKHVPQVGTPYSAPPAMTGVRSDLRRRAMYDGDDLTMVVYGDGEATVSVFQQPGRLDWDSLPAGNLVLTGGRTAWTPARAPVATDGRPVTVMISQIGHVVVTVVSDQEAAASTVVEGLPSGRRGSAWDRVHDACSRFTEVFALSG